MDRDQLATEILKALLSAPGLSVSLADESPRLAQACFTLADEMRKRSVPCQDASRLAGLVPELLATLDQATAALSWMINNTANSDRLETTRAACHACAKKLRVLL